MKKLLKIRFWTIITASMNLLCLTFIIGNTFYGWNSEPMTHSEVLFDAIITKWLGFQVGITIMGMLFIMSEIDKVIHKYKNGGINIQSTMPLETVDVIAKRVIEIQNEESYGDENA
jgi:hypothetical protein